MADKNEDHIYFAGFFDGEGSIGAYSSSGKGKYIVTISNTDVRPLLQAVELWGGKIYKMCKHKIKGAHMDVYHWHLYGQHSRQFLNDILPYSRIKVEQILSFLAILDVIPTKRGARRNAGVTAIVDFHSAQLKNLKKVGT
jgi:hypothetical protein